MKKEDVEYVLKRIKDTFKGEWGSAYEQHIYIQQKGNIIILKENDLIQLAKVMGCKFKGM